MPFITALTGLGFFSSSPPLGRAAFTPLPRPYPLYSLSLFCLIMNPFASAVPSKAYLLARSEFRYSCLRRVVFVEQDSSGRSHLSLFHSVSFSLSLCYFPIKFLSGHYCHEKRQRRDEFVIFSLAVSLPSLFFPPSEALAQKAMKYIDLFNFLLRLVLGLSPMSSLCSHCLSMSRCLWPPHSLLCFIYLRHLPPFFSF